MRVSSAGSALIVVVSEYRKRCGPAVGLLGQLIGK